MNRLETWTILILVGAAVAVFDLVNGWTANTGAFSFVGVIGLWLGSLALLGASVTAVLRDRKRVIASAADLVAVLAGAARGVRWSTLFGIGFSLLVFADCSSSVTSGNGTLSGGPMVDPGPFWSLAAWVVIPVLVALLLPATLMTAAQLSSSTPQRARGLARVSLWSSFAVVVAAVVAVPVGVIFGFSYCIAGTSPGACAAGVASVMSPLSAGSLALFLPYLLMVRRAFAVDPFPR